MRLKQILSLFAIGAVAYPLLEILWRGHSHWSMAVAGGCCLNVLARISRQPWRRLRQCLTSAWAITGVELVFGLIFNKLLRQGVWDYSHLPLHLWGQVCLPFTGLWFLLSIPVMALLNRLKLRGA